jgi:hypothetical protein
MKSITGANDWNGRCLEEVAAPGERLGQPLREGRVLEVGAAHLPGNVDQPHQVHRALHHVEVVAFQAELREEEARHRFRHAVGHLEAHRVAEVALRQLSLQRLAQVLHLLLLDEEVGVARHAELVAAHHRHAGEELGHVRVQHRREEDEIVRPLRDGRRQLDHARQHARGLHDRRARIAAERVAPFELHGEVEALVEDARERVRGIEPDRGEDRHHLAEEVVAHPGLLRGVPLRAAQEPDAFLRERGQDLVVEEPVLRLDDALGARGHLAEHLQRREAVGARGARGELDLLLHAREPDLEELVQVRGDDAEEAQPLERRHRAVLGLGQHAAVELQRLQLAIQEMLRGVAHRAPGASLGLLGHAAYRRFVTVA